MSADGCHLSQEGIVGLSGPRLSFLLKSFLNKGQSCRMRVHGSSMTPFIRHGDAVTIAPVESRIRTGDIVAATDKQGGRVLLHRVVRKRKMKDDQVKLLLRGDSGCEGDDWVRSKDVMGVITEVYRLGRRIKVSHGFYGKAVSGIARKLSVLRRRMRQR